MKGETGFLIVAGIVVVGFVVGIMYLARGFNAATLHTQINNPRPGVECLIVSGDDAIAVDCWESLK